MIWAWPISSWRAAATAMRSAMDGAASIGPRSAGRVATYRYAAIIIVSTRNTPGPASEFPRPTRTTGPTSRFTARRTCRSITDPQLPALPARPAGRPPSSTRLLDGDLDLVVELNGDGVDDG